jgi:hypothetical protein
MTALNVAAEACTFSISSGLSSRRKTFSTPPRSDHRGQAQEHIADSVVIADQAGDRKHWCSGCEEWPG